MPAPKLLMDRARLQLQGGQYALAESTLRRALASGGAREWLVNQWLAEALFFQDKAPQAIPFAHTATSIDPQRASGFAILGQSLMRCERYDEALPALERACELAPTDSVSLNALGVYHIVRERAEGALEPLQRAWKLAPDDAMIGVNLARVLGDHCQSAESVSMLEALDRRFPNDPDIVGQLAPRLNYVDSTAAEKLRVARSHAALIETPSMLARAPLHRVEDVGAARSLRIGLVSHDLRAHSCAYFVAPLLRCLDRTRASVHCFSTTQKPDDVTSGLRSLLRDNDSWHDCPGMQDEFEDAGHAGSQANAGVRGLGLARLIALQRIDILVELGGVTMGNAMHACALRPAPLILTAIGYPATLGMRTITHRIVDALTDPPGASDDAHSEQLLRLDGCFLCYDPHAGKAPSEGVLPAPRAVASRVGETVSGVEGSPVRFGSFNAPTKISQHTLDAWAGVLRAVPRSTLTIKGTAMGGAVGPRFLQEQFESRGVDRDRILCVSRTDDVEHHLRTYDRIDIALDTFPYHGTTTTCEALLMGVPVVTLAGDQHVARVGVSLLTHAGLPELIASTHDEFVRVASELAHDGPRLARYHATLRGTLLSSRVCDGASYARAWMTAIEGAWCQL